MASNTPFYEVLLILVSLIQCKKLSQLFTCCHATLSPFIVLFGFFTVRFVVTYDQTMESMKCHFQNSQYIQYLFQKYNFNYILSHFHLLIFKQ